MGPRPAVTGITTAGMEDDSSLVQGELSPTVKVAQQQGDFRATKECHRESPALWWIVGKPSLTRIEERLPRYPGVAQSMRKATLC